MKRIPSNERSKTSSTCQQPMMQKI